MTTPNTNHRRRRWKVGDVRPVRFPAWSAWSDARVRLDDAMLDSLAGMRLALVALSLRTSQDSDSVPDLFSDDELPYKNGFSVSVGVARHRIADAEAQLALNAFPLYVSGFDDLLGATIKMLRRLGIGTSEAAAKADRGVSEKVKWMRTYAGIKLDPALEHAYALIVEVRNSVLHGGASADTTLQLWSQGGEAPAAAREVWTMAASRPFPAANDCGRLELGDREIVACQRVLDQIGVDLARALRIRLSLVDWARLVAADFGPRHPGILTDPERGPKKLRAWARHGWCVDISTADAEKAIASPL